MWESKGLKKAVKRIWNKDQKGGCLDCLPLLLKASHSDSCHTDKDKITDFRTQKPHLTPSKDF